MLATKALDEGKKLLLERNKHIYACRKISLAGSGLLHPGTPCM